MVNILRKQISYDPHSLLYEVVVFSVVEVPLTDMTRYVHFNLEGYNE